MKSYHLNKEYIVEYSYRVIKIIQEIHIDDNFALLPSWLRDIWMNDFSTFFFQISQYWITLCMVFMHFRNHHTDCRPSHVTIKHNARTRHIFVDFMTCYHDISWKSTTPFHYKLVIHANNTKHIAIYNGNGTTLKHIAWAILHCLNSAHGVEWYFLITMTS